MTGDPFADFRNTLYVIWRFLRLPPPTPLQYEMAEWVANESEDRRGVEAFRGAAKSYITSAYVLDRLRKNPDLNILVVSGTGSKAEEFTTFCLQLLECPLFSHMRPRPDQRRSRFSFDVNGAGPNQNPSVKSVGVTSGSVGFRADIIILDDVETPANSLTVLNRDKIRRFVKEFEAILKPGGEIIVLGTPHTEDSLYNWLQDGVRNYRFRIWPVLVPDEEERAEYGSRLSPLIASMTKVGEPTEPTRFPESEIVKRRAMYGRAGFAMQFMLRTKLSDEMRYPLKLRDLVVTSLDGEMVPEKFIWTNDAERAIPDILVAGMDGDRLYNAVVPDDPDTKKPVYVPLDETIMVIDPSGRGEDEAGWAVLSMKHSYIFLHDAGGFREGYSPQTLSAFAHIAKKYKVGKVLVEDNFGDGMFSALLAPVLNKIHPATIEGVKHSIQKEKRIIDTLEPVVSNHRLVVDRSLFEKDFRSTSDYGGETSHYYQLWYQFTHIFREKGALVRDDRLDALAIGVGYFAEKIREDVDAAAERSREEALWAELLKWEEGMLGEARPSGLAFSRPLR